MNLPWFTLLLLAPGCFCLFSPQLPNENLILSHYTGQKITIDGNLSEWEGWDKHKIVIQDRELDQGGKRRTLSDNKVTLYSLWDRDHLYLAFSILDRDLRAIQTKKDHKQLYLDDMVEFLLDPNNDRTGQWLQDDIVYHINAAGVKKDDRGTAEGTSNVEWDGKASYAIRLMGSLNDTTGVDYGYTIEIAIPWGELGIIPRDGITIGFNAANGDCDGKGRQLFDWMGAWPFRSPDQFGNLVLVRP